MKIIRINIVVFTFFITLLSCICYAMQEKQISYIYDEFQEIKMKNIEDTLLMRTAIQVTFKDSNTLKVTNTEVIGYRIYKTKDRKHIFCDNWHPGSHHPCDKKFDDLAKDIDKIVKNLDFCLPSENQKLEINKISIAISIILIPEE